MIDRLSYPAEPLNAERYRKPNEDHVDNQPQNQIVVLIRSLAVKEVDWEDHSKRPHESGSTNISLVKLRLSMVMSSSWPGSSAG